MALFVDPIWTDAGLAGSPEFEFHLHSQGVRCGTIFLPDAGSGALIPLARNPGGPDWFSDLDYAYHPRSTPPTYGFVNSEGIFELRTIGD